MKKGYGTIGIVVGLVIVISLASEFDEMRKQLGLRDTLVSLGILAVVAIGLIYWVRRSKRQ
jgi:hypothetical protein